MNNLLATVEQKIFDWVLDGLGPINAWLNSLQRPIWHLAAVGLFAVSAVVVLLIPRSYIYAGAPDTALWRDLRIWTVVSLLPYMAAYYFLP